MTKSLESQFHNAMIDIYKKAKQECSYNASQFKNMISSDVGLKTAKKLLQSKEIQYGFTELWECGRLDLTVEAHVLKPEFEALFTEAEIIEARNRLESHGYFESVRDSELTIKDIGKEIKSEFSRYKVLYIESRNNPVCEVNIEKELNRMLDEGWVFKQLSTGGGIEPPMVNTGSILFLKRNLVLLGNIINLLKVFLYEQTHFANPHYRN